MDTFERNPFVHNIIKNTLQPKTINILERKKEKKKTSIEYSKVQIEREQITEKWGRF